MSDAFVGKIQNMQSVVVDEVLVKFDPYKGDFFCSYLQKHHYLIDCFPQEYFLCETWNYQRRPKKFIKEPTFTNYIFAFLGLIKAGYLLHHSSYNNFIRWATRPIKDNQATEAEQCLARRLTAAERLLPFLPWHAECLELSGLCNHWARSLGISANLHIGVRTSPFSSHAWCQYDEEVISDSQNVTYQFIKIWVSGKDAP